MKLISVEPTPSPNTMKLNLDETLPAGIRRTYTRDYPGSIPDKVRKILQVQGVTSVYHAADFLAVDRHPKGDWKAILSEVRDILGDASGAEGAGSVNVAEEGANADAAFGEVRVAVQYFRGIPMQVRVYAETEEQRIALPERFSAAAIEAGLASPNLIKERRLEEHGVRYGELPEVLADVARELDAAYPDERLTELLQSAAQLQPGEAPIRKTTSPGSLEEAWKSEDWRVRYAALERVKPEPELLPQLERALKDPQVSIRRLAAVYLGDLKNDAAIDLLAGALKDPSPIVRRTAGDTLSDIGDPAATPAMAEALADKNKLVRWRAARFLYEIGDERALSALRSALDEPEFEVRMQVQMALTRIEGGEAAVGSVWQQMTNRERG
ncbi:conserved virulence factor C family protein [Gorillibacterium massiliense]|uniref:conserved virulence factor C family protein n=1 Tax=Gorillibacterium massiliense TaxID=1280390 RepID=UPI0004B62683|nr:conserved virulence factor C family protein [Gorillibacterium massiliense]